MNSFFERFWDWWHREKSIKTDFNYLYFGFLFLFLVLLHVTHFLRIEPPLSLLPLFFLFSSFGQAVLETFFYLLIACVLTRWAPKWIFFLFIAASFVLQLLHFVDCLLVRLLDTPILSIIKYFFCFDLGHLFAVFQSLNLNKVITILIFLTFPSIALIGPLFYWMTHQVTRRIPLQISLPQIMKGIFSITIALFLLDLLAHPFLNQLEYRKLQKTLPFGTTFITPELSTLQLPQAIASARDETETVKKIPLFQAERLPNLYLFVIETLRHDFINDAIAPHLSAFGRENLQFADSFANSNSTQLSWFAIFHSNFPYHWAQMQDQWKEGSIPLRILKRLGYKIHIYSSANLSFFHMDHLIFGQKQELADSIVETASLNIQPWERDALNFDAWKRDLEKESTGEGHAFFFFLDSTHSEYSFPEASPLPFEPVSQKIDYFKIGPKSKELELAKNRYRNAIHYIDRLMGGFFDHLKERGLYENSIIAITGDHGEEFFEEGAIFHRSHLNDYQLRVPIFLKTPFPHPALTAAETSHLDLFPSILHYLTKAEDFTSLFDGQSIFASHRRPYRIAVFQNDPNAPCEFYLAQGKKKFLARFSNRKQLEILDLQVPDKPINLTLEEQIDLYFPQALDPLLNSR